MLQTAQTPHFCGGSLALVSVCIRSYNNEEFIAVALESVLD